MAEETKSKSLLDKLLPLALVALVGMSFAVGVLWQKVNSLEKGGSQAATATKEGPLSVNSIKTYAKELKLNTKNFNKCLDEGKYADKVKEDMKYGEELGVKGTPAFFINGKFLGGAYPFEYFKEIIDLELEGKGKSLKEYSKTLQDAYGEDATQRSFDFAAKTVEVGQSSIKGDVNASVTIVEFSDFECPYCQRHFTQTNAKIIEEYVNSGKVKMVFKHYPLAFHSSAQKAAEAAECANEQGKFWEMHDILFTKGSEATAQQ